MEHDNLFPRVTKSRGLWEYCYMFLVICSLGRNMYDTKFNSFSNRRLLLFVHFFLMMFYDFGLLKTGDTIIQMCKRNMNN